jgi:hypothetical protein
MALRETSSITWANSRAKAPWALLEILCMLVSGVSPADRARVIISTIAGNSESIASRCRVTSRSKFLSRIKITPQEVDSESKRILKGSISRKVRSKNSPTMKRKVTMISRYLKFSYCSSVVNPNSVSFFRTEVLSPIRRIVRMLSASQEKSLLSINSAG